MLSSSLAKSIIYPYFNLISFFERSPGFSVPLERSRREGKKSNNDRFALDGLKILAEAHDSRFYRIGRADVQ